MLKPEGAYKHRCAVRSHGSEESCVELRLNLVFAAAAVVTNMVALPVGVILDHYGPRVCGLIGSYFLAVGALLMPFNDSLPFLDGLVVGYMSLALGGPFIDISSFQLSHAFPRHSGIVPTKICSEQLQYIFNTHALGSGTQNAISQLTIDASQMEA